VRYTFLSYSFLGGWSGWSEWSSWGKGLCSGNQRIKTRSCTNPLPNSGSEYCTGENAKQESGSGIIIVNFFVYFSLNILYFFLGRKFHKEKVRWPRGSFSYYVSQL